MNKPIEPVKSISVAACQECKTLIYDGAMCVCCFHWNFDVSEQALVGVREHNYRHTNDKQGNEGE